MATRQTNSIEQSVGRIEGQLEGVAATLDRFDSLLEKLDARGVIRDEEFKAMRDDIAELKRHAEEMTKVKNEFTALQRFIHDGKMTGKGVVIGLTIAAGTGGAAVGVFFKQIVTWLEKLFSGS
jgi:hypothetical protein